MAEKLTYTIQKKDVGKGWGSIQCEQCGKREHIDFHNVLGKVMSQDVGKIMVKCGNSWQVENEEQFVKRLKN